MPTTYLCISAPFGYATCSGRPSVLVVTYHPASALTPPASLLVPRARSSIEANHARELEALGPPAFEPQRDLHRVVLANAQRLGDFPFAHAGAMQPADLGEQSISGHAPSRLDASAVGCG